MSVTSVKTESLVKRYGAHRALAGVSVEMRAGSLCAILGPNGAGKSTLLGILSSLVKPTGGSVLYETVDGRELEGGALRKSIGVLAHDSFIYGGLSGVENLLFWGRLFGVEGLDARSRDLLDEVGLDERARSRHAGTYSRGMLQRLALARTLLHDPPILLLDEPFTGLDREGSIALARTLKGAKERGRLTLVVTHDLESIAGVTDHVVVLRRGKVVHESRAEGAEGYSYEELKEIYHRYTE